MNKEIEIEFVKDHNKAKKSQKVTLDSSTVFMLVRSGVAKCVDKKDAEAIASEIKADEAARKKQDKKA